MEKRGQVYLLTTIIIVALIGSFVIVVNYSQERSSINIDHLGEELIIESEKVLNYGLNNNVNLKTLLENFTKTYVNHSDVDDSYFVFGNKNNVSIAGFQKLESGDVYINVINGSQTLTLNSGVYNSVSYLNPNENISLNVNGIIYNFTLKVGENFYYVLSKKIDDNVYTITNSYLGVEEI
jgi:hypothetical protein